MVDDKTFQTIVGNAPLVAIDFIMCREEGEGDEKVLLGLRSNEPAKGYLFVPGGRIWKNELFSDAVTRISKKETGLPLVFSDVQCEGIFEHKYDTSALDPKVSTHYIVIAVSSRTPESWEPKLDDQHENFVWMSIEELLDNDLVHNYTKNYFKESGGAVCKRPAT